MKFPKYYKPQEGKYGTGEKTEVMETTKEIVTENPFIGDNYFLLNPMNVLGEQTIKKGQYGSEFVSVEGTMSDLQRLEVPEITSISAMPNDMNLSAATIEQAITETIEHEQKELITPKIRKKRSKKSAEEPVAEQGVYSIRETAAMYNTNISRDELEAYFHSKQGIKGYDYSLYFDSYTFKPEHFIKKGLVAATYDLDKGAFRWEYVYIYKSGNISKKISWHKQHKEAFEKKFGVEQFEKQLKWLEECRPKPKGFVGEDRIIMLPHSSFAREIKVQELRSTIELNGETSLFDAFIQWLFDLTPENFKKSNNREIVTYYLRNKSIPIDRKGSKQEQERQEKAAINIRQRTKEEGDELFAKFLLEELLPEDQAKISYLWNEKYNSISEADLTKIPVGFRISKTFKDNLPFKLSATQRQAVAFMMEKKSGLLAYGVGVGKGHLLTSDILTPTGYRKMGELKVDDEVIAVDGTSTKITGVFPLGKIQCFEITFSDGSKTQISKDHLWKVQKIKNRENKNGLWHVFETQELVNHGLYTPRGDYYYSIPMVSPVQFTEQELPIHPYLLGVLIGDGGMSAGGVTFTNIEPDIIEKVKRLLPDDVELRLRGNYSDIDYRISRKAISGSNTFYNKIQALGLTVRSNEKFIPEIYKFSGIEQRLDLLRGMMDTDGYVKVDKNGKKGCCIKYYTVSEKLSNDVRFIVESFGGTVNITTKLPKYTYNNESKTGKLCYCIAIRLPKGITPVSSIRKLSKFVEKSKYQPARFIADIKDIGEHEAQCISVAHEEHLYVCENFIVTHNTASAIACVSQGIDNGLVEKPLFVVPTNTYFKWMGELQGYTDRDTKKYLQGLLPHLPKIVGLFNLNAEIVRNELKEYSDKDNKILTSIENLVSAIGGLKDEDINDKKIRENLSKIYEINWEGMNEAYKEYVTDRPSAKSAKAFILSYFRDELRFKIYELGKIKSFPSGTVFVTTEQGIQKLGIQPEHQGDLSSTLYTILSQGETTDKKREKEVAKLQLKIEQTIASSLKNAKLYVEDFGFDFVCFDESHYYKKIFTYVKGAIKEKTEDSEGNTVYNREKSKYELKSGSYPSARALSAFVLAHHIQRQNGNRNVLHLTATPFTNSPLEIYSMLALTNYKTLEDLDIANMVDFFDTFMKINYDIKYTAQKTVVKDVVLTGFNNLSSLRGIIYSLIDKKDEGANIIRPNKIVFPSEDSGRETSTPMTLEQEELIADIKQFMGDPNYSYGELCRSAIQEEIGEMSFDEMGDEVLIDTYNKTLQPDEEMIYEGELSDKDRADLINKIKNVKMGVAFNETDLTETESKGARILQALSAMRQVTLSPYTWMCKKSPEVKKTLTYRKYIESSPKLLYVMGCVKSVIEHHKQTGTKPSGQVIYMNAGVEYFPLIKEWVVKEIGLSESQVGMVTGGMSKGAKETAKRGFLNGDILVLIGSATISVGVDLQNNASVLYNCYYDWNPTDAQQIEGRIWRQGNRFNNVRIVYPMCYNSVDPVMFQYLKDKTSRINEIWNRDGKTSELDLRDFNPKQLQKDLITDPEEKADWEILEATDKVESEIIYFENRLESIENAQQSKIALDEDREQVKEYLTKISKLRPEIKRAEAKEGHNERRQAIIDKYEDDSIKMASELAKHKKAAYDFDKDPDGRYVAEDWSNKTDEEVYAECKKVYDWLDKVDYSMQDKLGDLYYEKGDIKDLLQKFRGNYKDYKQMVDRVLIPLGIDISNVDNPITEVKGKIEEKREQLSKILENKPERVLFFKKEMAAKRKNVSLADRIREFAKYNYLLDARLPEAIVKKVTLEEKLKIFKDMLENKMERGGEVGLKLDTFKNLLEEPHKQRTLFEETESKSCGCEHQN